jgi:hypothetical protein
MQLANGEHIIISSPDGNHRLDIHMNNDGHAVLNSSTGKYEFSGASDNLQFFVNADGEMVVTQGSLPG